MKNLFRICLFGLVVAAFIGCQKQDKDFKNFLGDKEVIYPGLVVKPHFKPGDQRVALVWTPSSDPSISRYVIYWNNKADSLVVNSTNHNTSDSITAVIPGLSEYIYSFTIFSYDNKGNRSIPLDINNVKVYGPVFRSSLVNRLYNVAKPVTITDDGNVVLNFLQADTAAINVSTIVKYTNRAGIETQKNLSPDSNTLTLTDFKNGSSISYSSGFVPVRGAIDTFYVNDVTTFPDVNGISICNKALFKENKLPNDAGTYESGTSVSKLWDGSVGPQGYPNIFHSDGGSGMPHTLTFDMGQIYKKLTSVEETGRDCCNNPDDFEIWGTADITNAATNLSAKDAGWPAEMQAKGWTLLKHVTRSDDGKAALKLDFDSTIPPVRYIRVRIKHVTTGDGNYSNMSELTFWKDVFN
ncbi:DUF4998 domain-containing protein [Mucilaginibacter phyllosphaerae]